MTYAATGDTGKIFAIDAKGASRTCSGTRATSTWCRWPGDGGNLSAGTADKAILYRVRPDGRAEALHDFDADEVRAIVRGKGAIYLAVNDFDNPTDANQPPTRGAQPAKGTQHRGRPRARLGRHRARPTRCKAKAALYRLDDDGAHRAALRPGRRLLHLAGCSTREATSSPPTGTQGKLYRVAPDRTVALATDVPERQALTLVQSGDGFLVGTGDVGAIYRVRPAAGAEATYLGKVLDAEAPGALGPRVLERHRPTS